MESNIHPSICICPRDRKWFFSFADVIVSSTAGTDTHNRIKIQLSKKLIDRVSYNFIDQKKKSLSPITSLQAAGLSFFFFFFDDWTIWRFDFFERGGIVGKNST